MVREEPGGIEGGMAGQGAGDVKGVGKPEYMDMRKHCKFDSFRLYYDTLVISFFT